MEQQHEQGKMSSTVFILLLGGILISLCLTALYYASEASKLARDYDDSQEDVELVQKRLKELEKTMKKINIYSEAIDQLTISSVTIGQGQTQSQKLDDVDRRIGKLLTANDSADDMTNLDNRLEDMSSTTDRLERTLSGLVVLLKHHRAVFNSIPTITPTDGYVSSNFGVRNSPFSGELVKHEGLDIGADEGTVIHAAADGVIEFAGMSDTFGKLVVIKHDYDIWTRYAHTSKINVKVGQKVVRGQDIAKVGTTGRSTGPHLHYEVWVNRKPVNPRDYLLDRQLQDVDLNTPMNSQLQVGGAETALEPKAAETVAALAAKTAPPANSLVSFQAPSQAELSPAKPWNYRKSLAALFFGLSIMAGAFVFFRQTKAGFSPSLPQ